MLDLAAADLDAAALLARGGNRYAAYHVQQGVEKMIKAILLHLGQEAGVEHRLDLLYARLPADQTWRAQLAEFVDYTPYATTFRYPTPGGRIPAAPSDEVVVRDVERLRPLLAQMRAALTGP